MFVIVRRDDKRTRQRRDLNETRVSRVADVRSCRRASASAARWLTEHGKQLRVLNARPVCAAAGGWFSRGFSGIPSRSPAPWSAAAVVAATQHRTIKALVNLCKVKISAMQIRRRRDTDRHEKSPGEIAKTQIHGHCAACKSIYRSYCICVAYVCTCRAL